MRSGLFSSSECDVGPVGCLGGTGPDLREELGVGLGGKAGVPALAQRPSDRASTGRHDNHGGQS